MAGNSSEEALLANPLNENNPVVDERNVVDRPKNVDKFRELMERTFTPKLDAQKQTVTARSPRAALTGKEMAKMMTHPFDSQDVLMRRPEVPLSFIYQEFKNASGTLGYRNTTKGKTYFFKENEKLTKDAYGRFFILTDGINLTPIEKWEKERDNLAYPPPNAVARS